MLKVLIGDIFESKADTLVNTVNCEGVMGKGIALDFKKKFPEMFKEYSAQCKAGLIKPGVLSLYQDLFQQNKIINFPTKKHWRSPTLVKDIEDGLDYFIQHYKDWNISSVAFPPLGCGNGGLTWDVVGPLMYSKLKDLDLDIEIYAPFGTSRDKLSVDFLEKNIGSHRVKKGSFMRSSLQGGEVLILETLYRLQKRPYAKPIGRIMFQKACYILTEAGAPTGLAFGKGTYGPYSPEVKKAITILANNNLTSETKYGNMLKTTVTDNYEKFREDHIEFIAANENYIDRAVDLLSRIKDTDQGEEVATVMHAVKNIRIDAGQKPLDKQVMAYIFDWKKDWGTNQNKKNAVAETISNLSMLGWINVSLTDSTAEVAV